MTKADPLGSLATLETGAGRVSYHRLDRLTELGMGEVGALPRCIRVLLESVLRSVDGLWVTEDHVSLLAGHPPGMAGGFEVPFVPARVLLQDFTGVPCLVDLAAMRSALVRMGGDPGLINPAVPVDLVIDHSVQVDEYGTRTALATNSRLEFERNHERYEFLHWGMRAFANLDVVPPSGGICHQVNLEFLAKVVLTRELDGRTLAFPDSLVGTDSHTTMINGLGVLGWGVGGIEAEAAMLGRPLYMVVPAVVGVRLVGSLPEGSTATDLVLTVTQMLRAHGVVGKLVEFSGPGLAALTVPDRATIANMAPEYGATTGFFPVDGRTLEYLRQTGRPEGLVDLVERYSRAQGLFVSGDEPQPGYETVLELDLARVEPSVAGPRRPQDRLTLGQVAPSFREILARSRAAGGFGIGVDRLEDLVGVDLGPGGRVELGHGAVVIAAITSCTNTSNPSVMIAAGLVAEEAVRRGLVVKPWVKTSLAPGSRVVTRYLERTGLASALESLGFFTVGYGCTTCIGNSGPLPEPLDAALGGADLVVAAVLSGNRNFEGRIHPRVRASYLMSPPLVVAYALAGRVDIDLLAEPLGTDRDARPVFLRDLWPSPDRIARCMDEARVPATFVETYEGVELSSEGWNGIVAAAGSLYAWNEASDYIHEPPFFEGMQREASPIAPIRGARVLVMLGDSITTDHISPAGAISPQSPAGRYLVGRGVALRDFNTYGSRRGDDRVMTRGTFANVRLENRLAPGTEGGFTTFPPGGEVTTIHDASRRYIEAGTPTLVLAGLDYGMGSSRDWAAKGTLLLGVKAVLARSFERIHRSNLVGMGVLPLQFDEGQDASVLGITGLEIFDIEIDDNVAPGSEVAVTARSPGGEARTFAVRCRLDSPVDVSTYRNAGILNAVLRDKLALQLPCKSPDVQLSSSPRSATS